MAEERRKLTEDPEVLKALLAVAEKRYLAGHEFAVKTQDARRLRPLSHRGAGGSPGGGAEAGGHVFGHVNPGRGRLVSASLGYSTDRRVAQLGEHGPYKAGVGSSILPPPTISNHMLAAQGRARVSPPKMP